jgi:hypothetical protein
MLLPQAVSSSTRSSVMRETHIFSERFRILRNPMSLLAPDERLMSFAGGRPSAETDKSPPAALSVKLEPQQPPQAPIVADLPQRKYGGHLRLSEFEPMSRQPESGIVDESRSAARVWREDSPQRAGRRRTNSNVAAAGQRKPRPRGGLETKPNGEIFPYKWSCVRGRRQLTYNGKVYKGKSAHKKWLEIQEAEKRSVPVAAASASSRPARGEERSRRSRQAASVPTTKGAAKKKGSRFVDSHAAASPVSDSDSDSDDDSCDSFVVSDSHISYEDGASSSLKSASSKETSRKRRRTSLPSSGFESDWLSEPHAARRGRHDDETDDSSGDESISALLRRSSAAEAQPMGAININTASAAPVARIASSTLVINVDDEDESTCDGPPPPPLPAAPRVATAGVPREHHLHRAAVQRPVHYREDEDDESLFERVMRIRRLESASACRPPSAVQPPRLARQDPLTQCAVVAGLVPLGAPRPVPPVHYRPPAALPPRPHHPNRYEDDLDVGAVFGMGIIDTGDIVGGVTTL